MKIRSTLSKPLGLPTPGGPMNEPRDDHQRDMPVGQIEILLPVGRPLDGREVEHLDVKRRHLLGVQHAEREVIDPAVRLLAIGFIEILAGFRARLEQAEDIAGGGWRGI